MPCIQTTLSRCLFYYVVTGFVWNTCNGECVYSSCSVHHILAVSAFCLLAVLWQDQSSRDTERGSHGLRVSDQKLHHIEVVTSTTVDCNLLLLI